MSAASLLPHLFLPRPRVLLARLVIGSIIPAAILAGIAMKGQFPHVVLFVVLFMVAQVSLALALSQKSLLAATFTFVQPGLGRGTALAQVAWAVATAAGAVALVRLLGGETAPPALTVFGMALTIHAACALAAFESPWSFQLPVWLFYVFFLVKPVVAAGRDGRLEPWLAAGWLWLGTGLVLLGLAWLRLRSRALRRRLCGSVVLGPEDIFRAGRMRDFQAYRTRHHRSRRDMAWRAAVLGAFLARAAKAAGAGRPAAARAWLLIHAGTAGTVTRRRSVFAIVAVALVGMLLCGGYFDSRMIGNLDGWFAALVFSWAAFPAVGACHAMTSTGAARPSSRRDGLRSEMLALAWSTPPALAFAVILYAVMILLVDVLPILYLGDRQFVFLPPPPHAVLLPVTLGPIVWFGTTFGSKLGPQKAAGLMAPAFFAGHAILSLLPYRQSIPLWLGITVLTGILAYYLRRRSWLKGDQAV